jgi:hypothetical protein
MTSFTSPRQRGGIGTPILAILVAAAVLGGAIWFIRSSDAEPGTVHKTFETGVKPAPKKEDKKERRAPAALNIPEVSEDTTNAMMGAAFKYRDRMGVTHYKHREIQKGIRGNGDPMEWTIDARIYPAKAPTISRSGMTNYTKKLTSAPVMELKNGKLVANPDQAHAGTAKGKKKRQ